MKHGYAGLPVALLMMFATATLPADEGRRHMEIPLEYRNYRSGICVTLRRAFHADISYLVSVDKEVVNVEVFRFGRDGRRELAWRGNYKKTPNSVRLKEVYESIESMEARVTAGSPVLDGINIVLNWWTGERLSNVSLWAFGNEKSEDEGTTTVLRCIRDLEDITGIATRKF